MGSKRLTDTAFQNRATSNNAPQLQPKMVLFSKRAVEVVLWILTNML